MQPGDIISHAEMCVIEGLSLQRGMNFARDGRRHVFLMSTRPSAPYNDHVEPDGRVLVYEGHDANRSPTCPDPKRIDQPQHLPSGRLTDNGRFAAAAQATRAGHAPAELIRVYEKIRQGLWIYKGLFQLNDAWQEPSGPRRVFKFRLEITDEETSIAERHTDAHVTQTRVIPSAVVQAVWARDAGRCVICGSQENLHLDHYIPYSKGGSSLVAENIRILCARHNLEKSDKIQ